jgi:hypothetical protein
VAQQLGVSLIDFRCSQIEAFDLRGLPDKTPDGRTRFLPPADLPRDGQGILFLDELNRASRDVMAAAFQLVLDRRLGEYELPQGWSIVCAGNFTHGEDYHVEQLDAAFRDRFCHLIVSSGSATYDEWCQWACEQFSDLAPNVIQFTGENLKYLEDVSPETLDFKVLPSRRS